MASMHPSELLPAWLDLLGAVLFVLIAASHLRHLVQTDGQRRPWHACHVLMAVSMASMYASGVIGAGPGVVAFWRVAIATAGVLAVLWAWWGGTDTVNPVWLLTALDLGAMSYMWSPGSSGTVAAVLVLLYLLGDGAMWTLDAHRSFERAPSLLRWLPLGDASGGTVALGGVGARAEALLGDRDISPSMVLMSLGMAYMVLAMRLVG
jgi:hypothetical protein